ncbi:MAG: PilZ domain-containing protein [Calditrichaeota bacterium]|nr:MAG: PilZ domain-containing protein [Calditrichota bacterium]
MENRKKTRYDLGDFISILDSATQLEIGKIQNLSEEGFMLECNERIPTENIISCIIKLPTEIKDHTEITFKAASVWCRKNISKNKWECGFQIETTEELEEILAYLILFLRLKNIEDQQLRSFKSEELENRRASSRHEPEIKLQVFERNSSQQVGVLLDISQSGAKLVTTKKHSKGDIVEYRIKLPERIFERDYLIFKAEVMWAKKEEFIENYRIGAQFANLDEIDTNIILFFILHHCNPQKSTQRIKITNI